MSLYSWSSYADKAFTNRFVKHETVKSRIIELKKHSLFTVRHSGNSVLGKEIYSVTIGKGGINIMLWSQMHGDEPTATMAIFDLLNFFSKDDEYNEIRDRILKHLTLHFIPMLNPDGAEMHQRRNAQGIDINRDFRSLQSPEARILMKLHQEMKPAFGFNLHDQDSLWSVTGSKLPASVSLLAPPVDNNSTITSGRLQAMQVVGTIYRLLDPLIPGQIGRWSHDYEPRAAGETFQSLGTSTILVETGGFKGDPERQFLRKLVYEALLHAFEQISSGLYTNESKDLYEQIPLNNKELFHLLIRNCRINAPGGVFFADIGLNYTEERQKGKDKMARVYTVADFGDLSTWNAYEIIDSGAADLPFSLTPDTRPSFTLSLPGGKLLVFEDGVLLNEG